MKIATSASKIIGVAIGEFTINLLGPQGFVKAKYALLTKEGVSGFVEKGSEWSEKFEASLAAFIEALEDEGLRAIFEETQASETPQAPAGDEPPQF